MAAAMSQGGNAVEQTTKKTLASTSSKTCVVCGGDCAEEPRIRDRKGRYFHEDCYEWLRKRGRHLVRRNGAALRADPELLEEVLPGSDDTADADSESTAIFGMAPQGCPRCGKPMPLTAVICTFCGFNVRTRLKLATARRRPGVEGETDRQRLVRMITDPGNMGLATLGVFIAMFIPATLGDAMASTYVHLTMLYAIFIAAALVVSAFLNGIVDGLLTLLLPFYAVYYLIVRCPHVHVRIHALVCVIASLGIVVLWIQDLVLAASGT